MEMKHLKLTTYLITLLLCLSGAAWSAQEAPLCADMMDYKKEAECLADQIDLRIARLDKYYLAAQKQEKLFGYTSNELSESQQLWEKYLRKHCDFMYSREQGSAGARNAAECQIRLYDERIYEIWKSYLTYLDSTPPVLPDPKK